MTKAEIAAQVSRAKLLLNIVNIPSPTSVLLGTSCCLSRRTSGINALHNVISMDFLSTSSCHLLSKLFEDRDMFIGIFIRVV